MSWAFAARVVSHAPLCDAISSAAIARCGEFTPQGLSNTAWAFATLEFADEPLRDATAAAARRRISDFSVQELNNTAWAFAYCSGVHRDLLAGIRQACLDIGRKMDMDGCSGTALPRRNVVDITPDVMAPLAYQAPEIVQDVPGIIVIFKPAGWETDVYDVEKYGTPLTPVARYYLLSTFMATHFAKEEFPISHSVAHGFGFVHRLDQMSSGLIIAATTFACHYLLQWQMCSYMIQRQYVVLCHGFLRPMVGGLRIHARILEGATRARSTYGERCRVDSRGKPAQTFVTVAAHERLGLAEEPLSLVAVAIVTGRQHQIRVHLQHVGHPTVYDGRYVEQDVLLQGVSLTDLPRAPAECPAPRPLPEKHRMELSLRGAYPWPR